MKTVRSASEKQAIDEIELLTAQISALEQLLDEQERIVMEQSDKLLHEQQQLRLQKSLLESQSEASIDGILSISEDDRILSFNRRFLELWGIPDEAVHAGLGQLVMRVMAYKMMAKESFQATIDYLGEHRDEQIRQELLLKDGRIFEAHSAPVRTHNTYYGRVWHFRDVTERKRIELNRNQLLQELQNSNQELSDFAYVVSHDLKAPLRAIGSLANWITQDYGEKFDAEGRAQLELLVQRVKRMHDFIDGILRYSRAGRVREDKVKVDLNVLVNEVIESVDPPPNIDIEVITPLPVIECQKTRIEQVFLNLISNAIKFMDKPEGRIRISCEKTKDHWKFSVADNGPGIEEKHFGKIFQIFQTLRPRDEFESTGVGLSVVKKIIEMYGGSVWVESTPGVGSRFSFTLPRP
ncbi:MAG TPA: ATP-binding protein [Acidobacteriota bacterium]|jgi:PAS domain S-box-containing protein